MPLVQLRICGSGVSSPTQYVCFKLSTVFTLYALRHSHDTLILTSGSEGIRRQVDHLAQQTPQRLYN